MTLVCKAGGFRIHVFPDDHPPPHVHVATDRAFIRVTIGEVIDYLSHDGTANRRDITKGVSLVRAHIVACRIAWERLSN